MLSFVEKLFDIIYEDADLLVINKAAGLVCHPTKNGEMSSLIGRARLYLSSSLSAACGGEGRGEVALSTLNSQLSTVASPHLVNRLDRETSGVVIVAKNSQVAGELGKIMESRAVQKEYLAIVHGHVRDDHGFIDAPLGKDEHSLVAVKDCVRPDGVPSQTEFWMERRFTRIGAPASGPARWASPSGNVESETGAPFTLLRIQPLTGRKHQIRIHLAHIGHPIVGEKLYGGDEDLYLALVQNRLTEEQKRRLIFPNQALHARAVRFEWRGQETEFVCESEAWFHDFFDGEK
jgi:23S rRNA pseudouridine1911/1915/1917 synthase